MKHVKKKGLSMLLAATMAMSLLPGAALAAEGDRADLILADEYEDYFMMGTFGNWNSEPWMTQGNVAAPSNALKLDSQIGNSNTNSLSRQAYLTAVEEIEADETLTEEEKEAKLFEANTDVILDSSRQWSGIQALEGVRQWNEEHPDQPKKIRAHVLAWHGGQQPNYFFCDGFYFDRSKPLAEQVTDEETMLARLDNYIMKMMEFYSQYKDVIICWDVVNEAIDDYSGQIRNSEDYQVGQWGTVFRHEELDDDPDARLEAESAWVRQAFESARKWSEYYGCDWKLYYNDFQDSNKLYEPKMSQTIKMLKPIYEAGNIDGYGMQGRLSYAYPSIDQLREQMELGFTVADEISFSESDIRSDFIPNPNYDPNEPTRRMQEGDPEWPESSGSYTHIGDANGNTFDVYNSPVMRDPEWGYGANYELAATPEKMTAQADYAADLMDLLIEMDQKYEDKDVVAYQWDGTTDWGTFNRTTGCTMWKNDGTPKYSFYAVAGAPSRAKMEEAIAAGPDAADADKYTAESWDAYEVALATAQALAEKRIYDADGVYAVKDATDALIAATEGLVPTDEPVEPGEKNLSVDVSAAATVGQDQRVPYTFSFSGENEGLGNVTVIFNIKSDKTGLFTGGAFEPEGAFSKYAMEEEDLPDGSRRVKVVLAYAMDNLPDALEANAMEDQLEDMFTYVIRSSAQDEGDIEVSVEQAMFTYYGDNETYYADTTGAVARTTVAAGNPYDIDGDGDFDQADITAAQTYYQAAEGDANWAEAQKADVNADGKVDLADLVELATAWLEVLG